MIRFFKFPFSRVADLRMSRLFNSLVVAASATSVLPLAAHAQVSPDTQGKAAPAPAADKDAPINVSAEQMTGRPDRKINLDRDVEVVRGATTIRADRAEYRIIQDEVEATGHVWMKRLQDSYTGDQALMNMETGKGYVESPTYLFGSIGGRGKADRIEFLSDDQARVTDGTYSTCEAQDPDWYVKASTLDLDSGRDVGTVHDGLVYFKGVPILATPWMSFPLSGERTSGVLPPTFGFTSTGGAELTVPYYFNIAPNRDLTVYPRYIARRGLQIGLDGRYMGEDYTGETKIEGIQDQLTGTGRYSLSSIFSKTLAPGVVFAWNVSKVSDNNYPSDFSNLVNVATNRILTRDVSLSYAGAQDNLYWSTTVRAVKYQLLQDVNSPSQKPYDRVPQLDLDAASYDVGGFDLKLNAQYASFSNSFTGSTVYTGAMVGGERAYATPSISYPIMGAGYYITPKAQLDGTSYHLNNVAPGAPTELNRVVPTYSLDAGLTFERETNIFGRDMTQTLEPRLLYVRTPYRDQSQYPIFDSGVADFNFAQIFSENRYTGHDRISDANQITGGVISRLFEENGLERLRLGVAQRFYLSDPKVTLDSTYAQYNAYNSDGTLDTITGSKSDLLLSAGGQVTSTISLDNTLQYSETYSQMVRANFGASWQPGPKKVLNLTYRLDRTDGVLKQIDVSGQWPVSARWYAVSRINYSIPDKTVAEGLLGMEYKADCWVLRLVAQRIPTASTHASTSFFVQLELNGLSRIGANPLDALSNSIPGYQNISKPDDTSRF